jgi:hypothetical protein
MTRAELEVLVDALERVVMQSDDEAVLLWRLAEGLGDRRSPTLGRAKMSLLLRCLERLGCPPWLPVTPRSIHVLPGSIYAMSEALGHV